ncbi:hypothetical protein LTR15_012780 [Elasticomyces elasticus]|nr:hypothetical protein LTR15_012780 [Elasticomyces elasticus]
MARWAEVNHRSAPEIMNTKSKYPFSGNQMVEIIRAKWYDGVPWWVNDELVDTLLGRVAVAAVYRPKNQGLWVHQSNVHLGSFVHHLTRRTAQDASIATDDAAFTNVERIFDEDEDHRLCGHLLDGQLLDD